MAGMMDNLPDGCRECDLDPTYAERVARRRDERGYERMDEDDDLPASEDGE